MGKKFRWIDENIDISYLWEKFSPVLQNAIREAEQADLDGDEATFLCACEGIEVQAKLHMPDAISKKEWEMICQKYWIWD